MTEFILPDSIPYANLQIFNESYKALCMAANEAETLYDAVRFEAQKDKYLRFKDVERAGPSGLKLRQTKLAAATIESVYAQIMDYYIVSSTRGFPTFQAKGPDDLIAYWNKLSKNVGNGMDLKRFSIQLIRNALLHENAYLCVYTDPTEKPANSLGEQVATGELDPKMSILDYDTVENWEEANGEFTWLRQHTTCRERSNPGNITAGFDLMVDTWTYYTPTQIAVYELKRKADAKGVFPKIDKTKSINRISLIDHDCGAVPIVKLCLPFDLREKMNGPAKALFNRAAGYEFLLDNSCFSLPVLRSSKNIKTVSKYGTILNVGVDGGVEFPGPNPQIFDPVARDIDRLTKVLFSVVQAVSLGIQGRDDNQSRMPTGSKELEYGNLSLMISTMSCSLKGVIGKGKQLIQNIRKKIEGDKVSVEVSGFKDEGPDLQALIGLLQTVGQIPGISPSAISYLKGQISAIIVENAPDAIRTKVQKELDEMVEANDLVITAQIAQGILLLIDGGLITEAEGRVKLGWDGPPPKAMPVEPDDDSTVAGGSGDEDQSDPTLNEDNYGLGNSKDYPKSKLQKGVDITRG